MHQHGLFDVQQRHEIIKNYATMLNQLNVLIDWENFRPTLEIIRNKDRKSNAGRKPFDVVFMFKILILQSLYNLSDAQMEFQITDRFSFMAFLNLKLNQRVPDEKSIWLFREELTQAGVIQPLFERFEKTLAANGFAAQKGQIIDATIVSALKQRNTRDENQQIKAGQTPEAWDAKSHKKRQKDTDSRWTKKRNVNDFGYKNHVNIDVKHKFISAYEVTSASVHNSQVVQQILDPKKTGQEFYADSAYVSPAISQTLIKAGLQNCIHEKGYRKSAVASNMCSAFNPNEPAA